MCVIISIYNNKKDGSKKEFLADNLFHFNAWNSDGTAFYGFDTEHETKTAHIRELKTTGRDMFLPLLEKYNVSHFHFRNATQGVVDASNIHFWKFKNWIMAHNGQVWDYGQEQQIFSDSQLLFRELAKAGCFEKNALDINRVNNIVSRKHFWGRLIFINTETKQAYYFGDFYLTALGQDILVVSTTHLEHQDLILYGLRFQTQEAGFVEGKIDGIFRIDARKQKTKKYKLAFNEREEYNDLNDLYDNDIPPEDYVSRSGWRTGRGEYKIKRQGEFTKI